MIFIISLFCAFLFFFILFFLLGHALKRSRWCLSVCSSMRTISM